jgi:dihydrofolate reductase
MSKVVFDISISLDGYIAAADRSDEHPAGVGGEQLHEWAFGTDERGREILEKGAGEVKAVIAGRVTYDTSVRWWGADGPIGAARVPTFVVTHEAPAESPADGVYRFVTGGIQYALDQAKAAAGGGLVAVMGGADLGRQFLAAGLLDEISLHVAPVLFGSGTRLFDGVPAEHLRLEMVESIDTPSAVHTRYRVING